MDKISEWPSEKNLKRQAKKKSLLHEKITGEKKTSVSIKRL